MPVDSSIHKELPIPRPRLADVLDVDPDVRGAIACELVVPLRSFMELVCGSKIIQEHGPCPVRSGRNQAIEIDIFKPVIGAHPHDVSLVADDVVEGELLVNRR